MAARPRPYWFTPRLFQMMTEAMWTPDDWDGRDSDKNMGEKKGKILWIHPHMELVKTPQSMLLILSDHRIIVGVGFFFWGGDFLHLLQIAITNRNALSFVL